MNVVFYALHPEGKHLLRLAKFIDIDVCGRLLPQNTWTDIKCKYKDKTVIKCMALCRWAEQIYKHGAAPSFKELSEVLNKDNHIHFLCQVGNNHSHR